MQPEEHPLPPICSQRVRPAQALLPARALYVALVAQLHAGLRPGRGQSQCFVLQDRRMTPLNFRSLLLTQTSV